MRAVFPNDTSFRHLSTELTTVQGLHVLTTID